jgi:prepilin-type N-terminal cleavage/methylation domain-containing protein
MISSVHSAFRGIGHRLRPNNGFTLVELLVAMVLMLVIMAGIYAIWFGLQRTYSFTNDDMTAQEQARSALNEMVEYIRTARQPDPAPSDELAVVIVSADANSLVCWTDVDRDPNHDLELVRFRVDEATRTLYRDDSQTGDPTFSGAHSVRMVGKWLSNNSETPLFSYTSGNGTVLPTPVTDPTQIREVAIDLRIDVYTDQAPIAHQLRSVVQPRNLRQY